MGRRAYRTAKYCIVAVTLVCILVYGADLAKTPQMLSDDVDKARFRRLSVLEKIPPKCAACVIVHSVQIPYMHTLVEMTKAGELSPICHARAPSVPWNWTSEGLHMWGP